jgi:hypothetical protein
MLNELRRFDTSLGEVDDMVALAHFAKGLRGEFEAQRLPVPEWLDEKIRQLSSAIAVKTADARALRLKEINAEEARLKTNAERKAELAEEKARLLAGTGV